ncbi:MAG: hypothetical protein EBT03_08060 [Betaproteobacteria bacterium]|nr:hypothetical protein [Betaproteobacteria bacterium]
MLASERADWDNQDIASNAASEVCRVVCQMKGIDPADHEPGLHQLSRDIYQLVYAAMDGRDRMESSDPTKETP